MLGVLLDLGVWFLFSSPLFWFLAPILNSYKNITSVCGGLQDKISTKTPMDSNSSMNCFRATTEIEQSIICCSSGLDTGNHNQIKTTGACTRKNVQIT